MFKANNNGKQFYAIFAKASKKFKPTKAVTELFNQKLGQTTNTANSSIESEAKQTKRNLISTNLFYIPFFPNI